MHQKMTSAVLRAPMAFFDSTPVGRIVNRFSSDVAMVDQNLPPQLVRTPGEKARPTGTPAVADRAARFYSLVRPCKHD